MVPETNMPVRFYLTPNREDGSASILVAEPLDYETTRNFMLRVRAQNVAAVPLAAFTTVYVNVTGVYLFVRSTFKNHIDKYPRLIGISRNWLFWFYVLTNKMWSTLLSALSQHRYYDAAIIFKLF